MEENGKEECCIWNGIGDSSERQADIKLLNGSEKESNDTVRPVSDIFENHSLCLPEKPVNEDSVMKMSSSENDRVEELTNLLRNHYVENNVKDRAEIVKEDSAVGEELEQTCSRVITCSGNVTRTILSNRFEIISVENEENITFKKDCRNGEAVYDSVNHTIECPSLVSKTNESNNQFVSSGSSNLNKTEDHIDGQERNENFNIRFRDDSSKTCKFCTKVNYESHSAVAEDANTEVMETASVESSCNICLFKTNNKRKFCHDSKSKNLEENETDLMRPESRISNKSSNSNISGNSETKKNKTEFVFETDPGVLSRRQKQIDYGKNTTGYQRYKQMVPKDQRSRQDPQTPPKNGSYSRRGWDGLIKAWRRKLHNWDPQQPEESDDEVLSLVSTSSFPTHSDDSENLNDASSDLTVEEQSFAAEIEINGPSNNKDAYSFQAEET